MFTRCPAPSFLLPGSSCFAVNSSSHGPHIKGQKDRGPGQAARGIETDEQGTREEMKKGKSGQRVWRIRTGEGQGKQKQGRSMVRPGRKHRVGWGSRRGWESRDLRRQQAAWCCKICPCIHFHISEKPLRHPPSQSSASSFSSCSVFSQGHPLLRPPALSEHL